jgi:hypothetical protein
MMCLVTSKKENNMICFEVLEQLEILFLEEIILIALELDLADLKIFFQIFDEQKIQIHLSTSISRTFLVDLAELLAEKHTQKRKRKKKKVWILKKLMKFRFLI